jgi:methylmalonyl-CoA mutase cobalamin-binding subunit
VESSLVSAWFSEPTLSPELVGLAQSTARSQAGGLADGTTQWLSNSWSELQPSGKAKRRRRHQGSSASLAELAQQPARLKNLVAPGGPPIVVALLDSGIDTDHHQSLSNSLWNNSKESADGIDNSKNGMIDDITGWNFVGSSPWTNDDEGHGTMMASIITRQAPMVRLMNLKVMDANGTANMRYISAAIDYAVENDADVINLSLGARSSDASVTRAIEKALEAGVIVVAASGNNGGKKSLFPANVPGVWSAGATDRKGNIKEWSNGGQGKGPQHVLIHGTKLKALKMGGGNGHTTGTSAAAAHLSGLFANLLYLQQDQR